MRELRYCFRALWCNHTSPWPFFKWMNSWNSPLVFLSVLGLKFQRKFSIFLGLFARSKQGVIDYLSYFLFFIFSGFFFFLCLAQKVHANGLSVCLAQSVPMLCCCLVRCSSLHPTSYPSFLPSNSIYPVFMAYRQLLYEESENSLMECGLNSKFKRSMVLQYLKSQNPHVVLLQETHLTGSKIRFLNKLDTWINTFYTLFLC